MVNNRDISATRPFVLDLLWKILPWLGLSFLLLPHLPCHLPQQPSQTFQHAHPMLLPPILHLTIPPLIQGLPYRDEDVLLSLQLLVYLSKYPHVRQAFYKPRVTFYPASTELGGQRFGIGSEIQYWACVIMRNACRKDDSRPGIR